MYESYHWHHINKVKQTLLGPIWILPYVTLQPLVWNEAASYQQAFLENEPTFTHHTFPEVLFWHFTNSFCEKVKDTTPRKDWREF